MFAGREKWKNGKMEKWKDGRMEKRGDDVPARFQNAPGLGSKIASH